MNDLSYASHTARYFVDHHQFCKHKCDNVQMGVPNIGIRAFSQAGVKNSREKGGITDKMPCYRFYEPVRNIGRKITQIFHNTLRIGSYTGSTE